MSIKSKIDSFNAKISASGVNKNVFGGASLIILGITLFALIAPNFAASLFQKIQNGIVLNGGWFYVASVACILITAIYLGTSKYSQIKLGPDHAVPDYSNFSWFSMLFSAGMGIGLMFYGVAEPVMHFLNPPGMDGSTAEAAREAMNITFFHWGVHAWGIYAVVALILAVFAFRHNLPLTMRSALYPLIGDKIYGPIGDIVDIFAIVGTMFGVATSLGLGVAQVNSGLSHLIPSIPESTTVQIILIIAITACATLSVVSGLDKGIKFLSNLNVSMAFILVLFVLLAGPTVYLFQALIQNIGQYISGIVLKTFNLYTYRPEESMHKWIGGWTIFYWGWWVSWAPFVGMFIARVSRGRTIREFILGVLLVPTGFTLVWMTAFGNGAIHMILVDGATELGTLVNSNVSQALFAFLERMPLASITTPIAMIMVILFFVTSSDSGSLVIDILSSNGSDKGPVALKVYWASIEGIVAIVLLLAGGLGTLQTMAIASALPFTIILLISTYGLFKTLSIDLQKQEALNFNAYMMQRPSRKNWRERLSTIVDYPSEERVRRFIENTVRPALEEVAEEMQDIGSLNAKVTQLETGGIRLTVDHGEEIDFYYEVRVVELLAPTFNEESGQTYGGAEVHMKEGGLGYDIMGWSKDGVINDLLNHYHKHMHFLHNLR